MKKKIILIILSPILIILAGGREFFKNTWVGNMLLLPLFAIIPSIITSPIFYLITPKEPVGNDDIGGLAVLILLLTGLLAPLVMGILIGLDVIIFRILSSASAVFNIEIYKKSNIIKKTVRWSDGATTVFIQ